MVKLSSEEIMNILGLTCKEPCQWCSKPEWNIYHRNTCPIQEIFAFAERLAAEKNMKIYIFKNGDEYTCSEYWKEDNIGFSFPGGRTVFKKDKLKRMKRENP